MSFEWSGWCAACLLLASLTLSATQSDQAVIVFNSQSIRKPWLLVDECTSERHHYELSKGQLLGVHLVSDISPTADQLHWCGMTDEYGARLPNPTMHAPVVVSRDHIRNSTKHELKVSLGSVSVSGYLVCYFYYDYTNSTALENARHYFIGCTTYIRLTDSSSNVPLIRFVSNMIHVTFQEFGKVEEIRFNDNSSLYLDFAIADQENCTYTIIQRDQKFSLVKQKKVQSPISEQENCSYKHFQGGQNETFSCNNKVTKKGGMFFSKLYIYHDNSVISLEEKNKYTNARRETAIKMIYNDAATIDNGNLIIRFNVETKVKPSVVISKCVSEIPHYVVYRRQNILIEILSDTFLVADLKKCNIGNLDKKSYHYFTEYDKRIQTKEKYRNIFKTKIFLSNIGLESGYIICRLSFHEVHVERSNDTNKQSTFTDRIICMARITIADGRRDYHKLQYISTDIEVSLKEFSNETEDIDFYENSSLTVNFDSLSEQDDCVYTVKRRDYQGKNILINSALTKKTGIFYDTFSPYNDRSIVYLEERNLQTNSTRQAGVRMLYRGIYNYTALYTTNVTNSSSTACNGDIASADAALADARDKDSDDYENIYAEVNEELLLLLHQPPQVLGCPPTR